VGAPLYDDTVEVDEGRAYVYDGPLPDCSGSACTPGASVWHVEGDQTGAQLGFSVSGAGDLDGDLYDEVIVGAPYYTNGQNDEGAAFVYYGFDGGVGTRTWMAESNQADAHYGWSVATATVPDPDSSPPGDVNGDGYDDVIVGAPDYDDVLTGEGVAFVYLGSDTAGLDHSGHPGCDVDADWCARGDLVGARLGCSVASGGDVDGDSYADLLVGACAYHDGVTDEGAAFLFYGSPDYGSPTDPLATWAWHIQGDQYEIQLGYAVASAGDVNGDGFDDVVLGAPYYYRGHADEGRALLFHGAAGITTTGSLADHLGLDPGVVQSSNWSVTTGGTVRDPRTETPDAVAYGSVPSSVLLTTGRARDEGLGNTDWLGDGSPDTTVFELRLAVPAGKRSLCFTTQFVTSEPEPQDDAASFSFSYLRRGLVGTSGTYDLTELATDEKNPPATYCIDVDDVDWVDVEFLVSDGVSGDRDSGLIVSRVHFASLAMPADAEVDPHGCFHNPAPHDVSAAAGTYSYSKPLLEVPGVSIPFSFAVNYSSAATKKDVLGQGWGHSYAPEAAPPTSTRSTRPAASIAPSTEATTRRSR
jgi:hypothetical protein